MFPCNVCSKVFTAKRNMLAHHKTQHEDRKFTCEVCTKSFTRKRDVYRHLNIIHSVNIQPQAFAPVPPAIAPVTVSRSWDDNVGDN